MQKYFSLYFIFQALTLTFIAFYMLFITILYPMQPIHVHPPIWFPLALTSILQYWHLALFYVITDMWSTIFLSILFWNIAPLILSLSDAKRFYPLFSLDIAGMLMLFVALFQLHNVKSMMFLVVFIALVQMMLLYMISRKPQIITSPKNNTAHTPIQKNHFVILLGIMVFAYEFVDNFLDFLWKWQVSTYYTSQISYSHYMSNVVFWTGILGTITCLFIARPMAQKVKWKTLALISPVLITIFGVSFLISYSWHTNITIFLGLCLSFFLQITKYTFFDNAKELALIVQDNNMRFHAKTFADGIMAPCGRSSSSLIQQVLFIIAFNIPVAFSLYGGILVLLVLIAWIYAIFRLNLYVEEKYAYNTSN
jgi:AAA family ATP:ADP antiporter